MHVTQSEKRERWSPGGLSLILGATVISGAAGYLLQILMPLWLDTPDTYLRFGVFWATTFLLVSMISGVQQEVSRAVTLRPNGDAHLSDVRSGGARRTLGGSAAAFVGLAILAALIVTLIGGRSLFGGDVVTLGGALLIACVGYTLVAVLSGVFYGIEAFGFAAATTVLDATLRFALVLAIALLGLGLVPIAYGVAIPFALTALLIGLATQSKLRGRVRIDVGVRALVVNAGQAMLAALATGVLISGLPTILSLTSLALGETALAGIVLALTLTRAPLVIPLLALQSYLVVSYRKALNRARTRALQLSAAIAVLSVLLASIIWAFGPWALGAIYGGEFALTGVQLALVIASGGATAGLCAVAPALLSQGRHPQFLGVWAISAIATVVALLFTSGSVEATLGAIALGPLIGWCVAFFLLRGGKGS